jgi:hypothetical protein
MTADIMGLNAGTTTLADISAKRNKDWESQARQRAREKNFLASQELNPEPPTVKEAKSLAELTKDEDEK